MDIKSQMFWFQPLTGALKFIHMDHETNKENWFAVLFKCALTKLHSCMSQCQFGH